MKNTKPGIKTIELPQEFIAQITRDDLKSDYDYLLTEYNKCVETGESTMFFSEDIKKEKREIKKRLDAFKIVLQWHGIEV